MTKRQFYVLFLIGISIPVVALVSIILKTSAPPPEVLASPPFDYREPEGPPHRFETPEPVFTADRYSRVQVHNVHIIWGKPITVQVNPKESKIE